MGEETAWEARKVVIVGAGAVGSTFAYALAQSGLADEIALLQRDEERITRTKLVEVATRAGLSSEQRGAMLRILTSDIQIWGVVVEVRGGSGLSEGRLLKRYGGITRIRTSTGRASASNVMEIGSFYTWKDLGIDSEMVDPTDLY